MTAQQLAPPAHLFTYPVKADDLIVLPNDAGRVPADSLVESIYQHGQDTPMVMSNTCVIIAGAERLAALRMLGCDEVRVAIASGAEEALDLVRWFEGRTNTRRLSPLEALAFSDQVKRALVRARAVWKRDGPSAVYRLFDKGGRLLYVGVTFHPKTRYKQHAAEKTWWPLVDCATVQWFDDRSAAEYAEAVAISTETPAFNDQKPRIERWT